MIEVVDAELSRPAHAQAVVRLLNEYALDAMGGGRELPTQTRDNLVDELRKREAARVVLGMVDGEPAGLLIAFEGFSTFACRPLLNVHDVVVSRPYRGRGLSTRMLERIEAIARDAGCCKLTLEVLEGNRVAQNAYRAFGFAGYELDPEMGRALFWEKKL